MKTRLPYGLRRGRQRIDTDWGDRTGLKATGVIDPAYNAEHGEVTNQAGWAVAAVVGNG